MQVDTLAPDTSSRPLSCVMRGVYLDIEHNTVITRTVTVASDLPISSLSASVDMPPVECDSTAIT